MIGAPLTNLEEVIEPPLTSLPFVAPSFIAYLKALLLMPQPYLLLPYF